MITIDVDGGFPETEGPDSANQKINMQPLLLIVPRQFEN